MKGGNKVLNQTVLVGRLTKDLEIKTLDNGKKIVNITVAIPRNFKNADGEYETDFINCILWNSVAENTAEYCKKGDIIGVRGRLQSSSYEKEDGAKVYTTELIAEKITFLSSKKESEEK